MAQTLDRLAGLIERLQAHLDPADLSAACDVHHTLVWLCNFIDENEQMTERLERAFAEYFYVSADLYNSLKSGLDAAKTHSAALDRLNALRAAFAGYGEEWPEMEEIANDEDGQDEEDTIRLRSRRLHS
jgi:hypothetical protein